MYVDSYWTVIWGWTRIQAAEGNILSMNENNESRGRRKTPTYTRKISYVEGLRHYAASRKVAGSRPDEVIEFFFSIYLILPAALGPGVYSTSNRNEYQKQKNVSGK
jgi:hypothetical protein